MKKETAISEEDQYQLFIRRIYESHNAELLREMTLYFLENSSDNANRIFNAVKAMSDAFSDNKLNSRAITNGMLNLIEILKNDKTAPNAFYMNFKDRV